MTHLLTPGCTIYTHFLFPHSVQLCSLSDFAPCLFVYLLSLFLLSLNMSNGPIIGCTLMASTESSQNGKPFQCCLLLYSYVSSRFFHPFMENFALLELHLISLYIFTVLESEESVIDVVGLPAWESTPVKTFVGDPTPSGKARESSPPQCRINSPLYHDDSAYGSASSSNVTKSTSDDSISSAHSSGHHASPHNRKNWRTSYSPDQVHLFQNVFTQTPYPDAETIEELSSKTNISEKKIRVRQSNNVCQLGFRFTKISQHLSKQ